MHDEALLEQIRAYFRQHRATYTLDALRERLIRDGAPPDAVGQVLVEMSGQPQPPPGSPYLGPAPTAPATGGTPWSFKTIFGLIVVVTIANLAVLGLSLYLAFATEVVLLFYVVAGAALVAEVVGIVHFASRNRSVSLGLLLGIIATPLVVALLLLGTCLYIISTYQ
jgi:hypothetical protein